MSKLNNLRKLSGQASEAAKINTAKVVEVGRIAAESARNADLSSTIDTTLVVYQSAAAEAKLTNRNGEISKWRVARAAATPAATGQRLAAGASKGLADAVASGRTLHHEPDSASSPTRADHDDPATDDCEASERKVSTPATDSLEPSDDAIPLSMGQSRVVESLRLLKGLHDEGILTDDEYEAKRKPLADQL